MLVFEILIICFYFQSAYGFANYDYEMAKYGRDCDICLEYVFDTKGTDYASQVGRCVSAHNGTVLKLDTLNEWILIKHIQGKYVQVPLYIGVKMEAYGDEKLNLRYDNGDPFDYTKYSISFYEDVYNLTNTLPTSRVVYHLHANGIIHKSDLVSAYGIICSRPYNSTQRQIEDPNMYRVTVNSNVTRMALVIQERSYPISLVECTALCLRMDVNGGGCSGIEYDTLNSLCALKASVKPVPVTITQIIANYYETDSNSKNCN